MGIKGSYFPYEDYDFDKEQDKLPLFVEMLKNRGCYIGSDWHIHSKRGTRMSHLMKNGYYMISAQYNKKVYRFMEHRAIWVWNNGAIPEGLVVNHKDYNRWNNNIDNLEIVTQKENVEHSRPNFNPAQGDRHPRSKFTNKQAAAIKTLAKVCGWTRKQIAELVECSDVNVTRIVNNQRYPNVVEPLDIMSAYPIIVDFTRNKSIGLEEELKNYTLGLAGEAGEVADLVKKHFFHGHELNISEIIYELGDVLYYLCAICLVLGIDWEDIMLNNNAKLMARYGDGFSKEKSKNRIEYEN